MKLQILIKQKESFIQETVEVPRYFHWGELVFCPVCHECWAEIVPEGVTTKWSKLVLCIYCSADDEITTPGSILNDQFCNMWLNRTLLNALPDHLVIREFELSLKLFEVESCQNQQQSNPFSLG